jgi:YD repeat-containing protein
MQQLYVHQVYDAISNQVWTSLSTDQADPSLVAASEKSTFTYLDTGWVRTSKDSAEPAVTFDYDARGHQSMRLRGTDAPESWTYFADGDLKQAIDPDGMPTTYAYDANDNTSTMDATSGVQTPDESALAVRQTYDGFDQLMKTRQQKLGKPWHDTTYGYDLNGNVTSEQDDAIETPTAR